MSASFPGKHRLASTHHWADTTHSSKFSHQTSSIQGFTANIVVLKVLIKGNLALPSGSQAGMQQHRGQSLSLGYGYFEDTFESPDSSLGWCEMFVCLWAQSPAPHVPAPSSGVTLCEDEGFLHCWKLPRQLAEPRTSDLHLVMFYKGAIGGQNRKLWNIKLVFWLSCGINSTAEARWAEEFKQQWNPWMAPALHRAIQPARYVKHRCWKCWFPWDQNTKPAAAPLLLLFPCCRGLISSPNRNSCVGKKMATINLNLIIGMFSLGN